MFHNEFTGFSGFIFCRKLARTKTQQCTDKSSENNGHKVFSRDFVLLMRASTGVMSTLSYHLSSIHYTSSPFAPTSLFTSASATDRVFLSLNDFTGYSEHGLLISITGDIARMNRSQSSFLHNGYLTTFIMCYNLCISTNSKQKVT